MAKREIFQKKNHAICKSENKKPAAAEVQLQYREVSCVGYNLKCYYYSGARDNKYSLLFTRENNSIIVATYAIFETFSVSTGVFYLSHQTSRDKTGSLSVSLGVNVP